MGKFAIVLGVMMALSLTGIPTAVAVFIWTVALPYMVLFAQ